DGIWFDPDDKASVVPFADRIIGRLAAGEAKDPKTGETLLVRNQEITDPVAQRVIAAKIGRLRVRSPLSCHAKYGICRACYGRNRATDKRDGAREEVRIIAAQSIGEPATQPTTRTFHTGGSAAE